MSDAQRGYSWLYSAKQIAVSGAVSRRKNCLFGSFARDEQTEHSDIDLIIELEEDTPHIYELKQALREVLESQFNRPVEIAREKYLRPYAKKGILSEAKYV